MIKASRAFTIALAGLASLYGLGVPAACAQGYNDHNDARRFHALPFNVMPVGYTGQPFVNFNMDASIHD